MRRVGVLIGSAFGGAEDPDGKARVAMRPLQKNAVVTDLDPSPLEAEVIQTAKNLRGSCAMSGSHSADPRHHDGASGTVMRCAGLDPRRAWWPLRNK
jgi:hypothetical protein